MYVACENHKQLYVATLSVKIIQTFAYLQASKETSIKF